MNATALTPSAVELRVFCATPGNCALLLPDAPRYTILATTDDYLITAGRTREELTGKGLFEAFPSAPGDADAASEKRLRASLEKVRLTRAPDSLPFHRYDIPAASGGYEERYWSSVNKPVFGADGELVYIIHSAVDVTAQVAAEKKLEAINDFRKAYEFFMAAPVIVGFVRGDDYVIELANESLLEVWGRGQEVIGKPLFDAIPELATQGFKGLLEKVRTSGEPFYAYEFPITLIRQAKEEVLYFDFVYKPFYETETVGKASGVICVGHDITEKVRTKQKFKNVLEQAKDPILILKGENMVLEVANEALLDLWKVDESAIGKPFLDILPEMKDQGFLELLQNVYRTGEPFQGFEMPAVFDQGEGKTRTVYFNFTYQAYREADGTISGVLVVASDVTGQVLARRQVEESQTALRLSNERFAMVSRATQEAIWDWNIPTNELVWNEAVYTMFGYNPDEVDNVDKWWQNHLHPDERERVLQSVQTEIDKGGILWTEEYPFRCADGSYRMVHDRAFIQYDEGGKAVRMIGSMQDITERKKQELALQESHRQWRQLANTMPVIVWTADVDGRVNFFNDNWYAFTGLTKETSIDFGWTAVVHPDDRERCLTAWRNACEKESLYEMEVRYRTKDGSYRWVLARGVPIKENEAQSVTVWYGTSTDIHEQKRLTENLEASVAERTAELKRINASLEDFAYAASHDMKEPIRKIHFFADRLKNELGHSLSENQKHLFSRMENASRRMDTLIDDLLTYSQASKGIAEWDEVNLNEKVRLVLEDLELEVAEKKATVVIEALPVVRGNKRQFQQLFQNLIGNALKYSKPDVAPQIRIAAKRVKGSEVQRQFAQQEGKSDFYLLTVSDNGIGFEQADAERIFNVFTRLHGNAEYRGTGVGLSIVQKVVENHRGHIWAESAPGAGATFSILLPAF